MKEPRLDVLLPMIMAAHRIPGMMRLMKDDPEYTAYMTSRPVVDMLIGRSDPQIREDLRAWTAECDKWCNYGQGGNRWYEYKPEEKLYADEQHSGAGMCKATKIKMLPPQFAENKPEDACGAGISKALRSRMPDMNEVLAGREALEAELRSEITRLREESMRLKNQNYDLLKSIEAMVRAISALTER